MSQAEELHNRVANFLRHARKYRRVISWLLADSLWRLRSRTSRIVAFGALNLVCQAGTVAVLYFYADALEQNRTVELVGRAFAARASFTFLWLAAGSALALIVLGAAANYVSRSQAISLGRWYEETCGKRAFTLATRLPDLRARAASRLAHEGGIRQIAQGDARYCGMAVRIISYAMPALINFAVSVVAMAVIDPQLTAIIAGLATVIFLFQYPANLRAAKFSSAWENHRSPALAEFLSLLHQVKSAPAPIDTEAPALRRIYEKGSLTRTLDAFWARLRAIEEGTLVSQIGSAVVLCAAILIIGARLLEGSTDWGLLVVYLGALRVCLSNFVQIGRAVAGVSRFYPQIARYSEFVGSAEKTNRPAIRLKPEQTLTVSAPSLVGGPDRVAMRLGDRLVLLTPAVVDRTLLHVVINAVVEANGYSDEPQIGPPALICAAAETSKETARKAFGLSKQITAGGLQKELRAAGLWDEGTVYPLTHLDAPAPSQWSDLLSARLVYALRLIGGLDRGCDVLLLEWEGFMSLGSIAQQHFLGRLTDRIALFVYADLEPVGALGESAVLVCDNETITGWMPLTTGAVPREVISKAFLTASIKCRGRKPGHDIAGVAESADADLG